MQKAAGTINVPKNHKLAVLKQFGVYDCSKVSKSATVFFPDNSLFLNTAKLKEIGYLFQQSGRKIDCFLSEPLPPVDAILLHAGLRKQMQKAIAAIDAKLSGRVITKVVVYNPESLSVLRRFSRSGVEFVSIVGFYAEMLKKKSAGKLKFPAVTYQDPCHLGRYVKDYTSAREVILSLGLHLKEMWRSRNNALCCGAGGGLLSHNSGLAKTYADCRWREARATRTKVMVTACPRCHENLTRSKPGTFKVIDITTMMARAYGYKGEGKRR